MTGGRAWLDSTPDFFGGLSLADIGPQANRDSRDAKAASSVPVGERFRECARLAAETTAEESLALQAQWLKERT